VELAGATLSIDAPELLPPPRTLQVHQLIHSLLHPLLHVRAPAAGIATPPFALE